MQLEQMLSTVINNHNNPFVNEAEIDGTGNSEMPLFKLMYDFDRRET